MGVIAQGNNHPINNNNNETDNESNARKQEEGMNEENKNTEVAENGSKQIIIRELKVEDALNYLDQVKFAFGR